MGTHGVCEQRQSVGELGERGSRTVALRSSIDRLSQTPPVVSPPIRAHQNDTHTFAPVSPIPSNLTPPFFVIIF